MLVIIGTAHSWPWEVKLGDRVKISPAAPLFCQFSVRELNLRPSLPNLTMAGGSTLHMSQVNRAQPPTEINQRYATQEMEHLGFRFEFDREIGQFFLAI